SWLALPLFRRIDRSTPSNLKDFFAKPFAIYLLFVPIAFVELLVNLSPGTVGIRDFGGWSPFTYLIIFISGYFIATDERFRLEIARLRFLSLTFGLLATIMGYLLAVEAEISTYSVVFSILRGFNTWCWLLAFLGLAAKYLNFDNGFLKYANEAILPFYILHQTVIVILGYLILEWNIALFPKYLFLATASFIVIMALYEFLVKRIRLLRTLFGMKG
ncbi:MAG: acyltransferase family protein, partial [Chloroflexi bacterium]|nr:acyltransferase family protein [Chloroflexota bacterium]